MTLSDDTQNCSVLFTLLRANLRVFLDSPVAGHLQFMITKYFPEAVLSNIISSFASDFMKDKEFTEIDTVRFYTFLNANKTEAAFTLGFLRGKLQDATSLAKLPTQQNQFFAMWVDKLFVPKVSPETVEKFAKVVGYLRDVPPVDVSSLKFPLSPGFAENGFTPQLLFEVSLNK